MHKESSHTEHHTHTHDHDHEQSHTHDHGHEHSHGHHDHGHKHEHDHEHGHDHHHTHGCPHSHGHGHGHGHSRPHGEPVIVLRPYSGIAGDIMVAGLAGLLGADQKLLDDMTAEIGMKELGPGSFTLETRMVNAVSGLGGAVSLPHEHAHRSFTDIRALIQASAMAPAAVELAVEAFRIIAEAEGAVHGKDAASVTFHEVGALDSILDICLAASLFARLAPAAFICGPLPLCDGVIRCAHGEIPSPAPAVLRMLHGMPVTGFAAAGETVTPTGIALLKAFRAEFGPWPAMILERESIAYGTKVFTGVPNGALFASGKTL